MRPQDSSERTRIETVTSRLRREIMSGRIKPGARLTESATAAGMGVSRTPVVAALKALTEQGLVRHAPNHGYWVRELSLEELIQGVDVLAALEGMGHRQRRLRV